MDEDEKRIREYNRKQALHSNTNSLRWANLTPIAGADLSEYSRPLAILHFPLKGFDDSKTDIVFSNSGRGYWVVKCFIPLGFAQDIYRDRVGKDLIRAGGHCGCLPPEEQCGWIAPDGKEIVAFNAKQQEAELDSLIAKGILKPSSKDCYFNDDPQSIGGKQYVTMYHIDGDLGLRVFTDWIDVIKALINLAAE